MSGRRMQRRSERDRPRSTNARTDVDGTLFVLRVGERIVLDILVDCARSSVMTFVRIDGELLAELPVLGDA